MKKNTVFLRAFILAVFFLFSGFSAFGADDKELAKKKGSYKESAQRICQFLSKSRVAFSSISKELEKMKALLRDINHDYPKEKKWAAKALRDLNRFGSHLKPFEDFVKEHRKLSRELKDYEKKIEKEIESLLGELKKNLKALKGGKIDLEKAGRSFKEAAEKMEALGKRLEKYFATDPEYQQLQRMAKKAWTSSGSTKEGINVTKSLNKTLRDRLDSAKKQVEAFDDRFKSVAKGLGYPKFQNLFRQAEATRRLIKKNAKLVAQWEKENDRLHKEALGKLAAIGDLVRSGKIDQARKKDVTLYKKLVAFYKKIRKMDVHEALEEEWIVDFTDELMALWKALGSLGRGMKIFDEVEKILTNLSKTAREDLQKSYGDILRKKDLKELEKAAGQLREKYRRQRKELIGKVREGSQHFKKGLAYRAKRPFDRIGSTIKDMVNRSQQQGLKSWSKAYKDQWVKACLGGTKSDYYDKMEDRISLAIIGDRGKEMEEMVYRISRDIRRRGNLSSSQIQKLKNLLAKIEETCKERKIPPPLWVKESGRFVVELISMAKLIGQIKSDINKFEKEVKTFQKQVFADFENSKKLIEQAKTLDHIISYRKKINQTATIHRKKVAILHSFYKATSKSLRKVDRIYRPKGPLGKLADDLRQKGNDLQERLDEMNKDLNKPRIKAMLHGVD